MSTTSLYDEVYRNKSYNSKEDFKIRMVKDWADINGLRDLLDVGCGRGHYLRQIKATGLEPSKYLCDNDLKGFKVINSDIQSLKTRRRWDGLYCMDVLEHISYDDIDECLDKLSKLAPKAIYGIANHSDYQNGVELHLIQKDAEWWDTMLKKYYDDVKLTYEPFRFFVFEVSCSQ